MKALEDNLRRNVLQRMDLTRDLSDEEILHEIQNEICRLGKERYLSMEERMGLQKKVFYSLRKLDVLEDLLADEKITEIMVNGAEHIFVEKEGKLTETGLCFSSEEKLEDVIQKIVGANNKAVNSSHPIVDTKLADGTRVNVVLPPVAIDGSILTIRKFPKQKITMRQLLQWNTLSEEIAEFLKKLVIAGYNIFVSGATSSGKTTFLNAMAEFIPERERVITIEDTAELQLLGVKNLVRLEAREATMEGKLEVSMRDLLRTSLRMRPDRIIVGECRGKEALEVLQSFGTGHDGSFSTGHANSAKDMLSRLETMSLMAGEMPLEAIRSQIAAGVDIIVHLGRLQSGERKLLQMVEILGMKNHEIELQVLYEHQNFRTKDGVEEGWIKRNELYHVEKWEKAGFLTDKGG